MKKLLGKCGVATFNANLEALSSRYDRDLEQWLWGISIPKWIEVLSASGNPGLRVFRNNRIATFHSPREPAAEARRQARGIVRPYCRQGLLYGFGLGYLVEELLSLASEGVNLLVWDLNPVPFAAAMALRDMTGILADPRLRLLIGQDFQLWGSSLNELQMLIARDDGDTFLHVHRPSLELIPAADRAVRDLLEQIKIQAAARERWGDAIRKNIEAHRSRAHADPGVERLFGLTPGAEIIVVGAGPSLDRNVSQLTHIRDRMPIVATDGAYNTLMHAGVEPHFVVILDPQSKVTNHFRDAAAPQSAALVYSATSPPEVLELGFPRRYMMIPAGNDSCETAFPGMGTIRTGGTVGLACLDLAVKLGASKVILTGMDLAYGKGGTHTRHSAFNAPHTTEARSGLDLIPAWGGGRIETAPAFRVFLDRIARYIKDRHGIKFVDSTEGGVHIPGCEDIPLSETLFKRRTAPALDLKLP